MKNTNATPLACSRCGRKARSLRGWNGVFRSGVMVAAICPDCQTDGDHVEAQANECMLDYRVGGDGRVRAAAKGARHE